MSTQVDIAATILRLVEEGNGQLTVNDLKNDFPVQQRGAVVKTLNRLLNSAVGKLHLKGGRLQLGPGVRGFGITEVGLELEDDNPSSESRTRPNVLDYSLLLPDYEQEINLPQQAKKRKLAVTFEFQISLKDVKRVGVAARTLENSIQWIPPASKALQVTIENPPKRDSDEQTAGSFLALIAQTPTGHVLRYYKAPEGKVFVLRWKSDG